MKKHIVVTSLTFPDQYTIWQVEGHTPANYVCDAPPEGPELDALIADLEAGSQTLITDYVARQEGQV